MTFVSIGNVLFTKTQQKVLSLLYGKPDQSFYFNEIVRRSDMGKGTIKRELERMNASELLLVERIGNQTHYRANKDCPIYTELLAIVRKTFGVVDVIKAALEPIDEQISLAFVYGSVARSEDTVKSDIDFLVVAKGLSYVEIMELLADTERSLGRPINPTIYDSDQVIERLKGENAFLTRVMEQPKLWIKGDADDISKFR
jgi:predicted nucleotidyltransferase